MVAGDGGQIRREAAKTAMKLSKTTQNQGIISQNDKFKLLMPMALTFFLGMITFDRAIISNIPCCIKYNCFW